MDRRRLLLSLPVAVASVACSLTLSVDLERSAAAPATNTVASVVAAYRGTVEQLCTAGTLTPEQCAAQRTALDDLADDTAAAAALARLDLESAHVPAHVRGQLRTWLRTLRTIHHAVH